MENDERPTLVQEEVELQAAPSINMGALVPTEVLLRPRASLVPQIAQTDRVTLRDITRAVATLCLTALAALPSVLLSREVAIVVAAHLGMASLTLIGVGPFQQASQGAAYSGPGDVVGGALAWWGLRAYSAAKRGNPAVNVCIPADAACADLSTDPTTGALVISTIGGSSCSVVTCTVKTIYDQTGANSCNSAACDLTNATEANRPVLTVSCGVTSKPCLTYAVASSQQLAKAATNFSQSQPYTVSAVARHNAGASTFGFILSYGSLSWYFSTGPLIHTFLGSSDVSVTTVSNTWYALQFVGNGASSDININGSANAKTMGITAAASTSTLRMGSDNSNFMTGNISEEGFWAGSFSGANSTAMASNQQTYWGF